MSSTTPSPDDSQRRPEGNLGHPEQRRDDVFDQVGEVAPGWGEQPQDAYEQGDSGGWGAPGQHDTSEQPDPRTIEYARSLLVACPGKGRKLHCWHCSRCGYAPRCNAWRRHYRQVKEFEGRGKPYSLLLLEDMAALDAPGVLQ